MVTPGPLPAYRDNNGLTLVEIETGATQSLSPTLQVTSTAWLADESALLVGALGTISRHDPVMGTTEVLLERYPGDDYDGPTVSWSPDGQWIAWIDHWSFTDGYVAAVDGSEPLELFVGLERGPRPSWSPSSSWVAFLGTPYTHGCFSPGSCAFAGLHSPPTGESSLWDGIREIAWAPFDDVVVVAYDRSEDDGDPLTWRLVVTDYETGVRTEVSDLAYDDRRSDSAPAWRIAR